MTALRIGRLDCEVETALATTDTRVVLKGRLDDAAVLTPLIAEIPATGAVTIDTSAITFCNSLGMREWIRLVRAIGGRGQRLTLERVADVLITQMNMIPEFRGAATITSFHAVYVCSGCGEETTPIVDAIAHAVELRALALPKFTCGLCGEVTELGDFPERYASVFQA